MIIEFDCNKDCVVISKELEGVVFSKNTKLLELVPFAATKKSKLFKEHPDWFIKEKTENHIKRVIIGAVFILLIFITRVRANTLRSKGLY